MVTFEQVTGSERHVSALYRLLNARTHRISAAENVSEPDHRRFVEDHPYRSWWLVLLEGSVIGSVYLGQDNSVGVDLTDEHVGLLPEVVGQVIDKHRPLPAIPSVRRGSFFINVAPSDLQKIDQIRRLGWEKAQETFAAPKS